MSLQEQLQERLDRLDGNDTFDTGPQTIALSEDGRHFQIELTALGALGCSINHVSLACDRLADATVDRLNEISQSLSTQITYLLEPIATIEVDPDQAAVQLRSDPPHRVANSRTYYELVVRRGGELCLRRYRAESRQQREQIPAQLTREVLEKLVTDFAAAVQ